MNFLKKMNPGRYIALGFTIVILLGAILLYLPITRREGVEISFIDALFTSTSAICVTGLIAIDTYDTYNVLGQIIMALLIQIGGLGVTCVSVSLILLARKKVDYRDRILLKQSLNLDSVKGVVRLVKAVLLMTLFFEGIGAVLSFIVFSQDNSVPRAIGISLFHSIASFNNSGFDILGGFKNLLDYKDNILLNLTTCGLIIVGGLGFIVIQEMLNKRDIKKYSLHTKIVITMTITLLIIGTLLIKITENITWLGAFFFSCSARTAGFSTFSVGDFTTPTQFILIILMFIGASPGSTGGGIKTTTTYTLLKNAYSVSTNKYCTGFKRKIPNDVISKAYMLFFLAILVVCVDTLLLTILEPQYSFMQILFEAVSSFGTVGLSTGITPELKPVSKIIIIVTMFIGRVGLLTITSMWSFKQKPNIRYSEEPFTIG